MICEFKWHYALPLVLLLNACNMSADRSGNQDKAVLNLESAVSKKNRIFSLSPQFRVVRRSDQKPLTQKEPSGLTENHPEEPNNDWSGVINDVLAPRVQEFEISSSRDTLLQCEKGTRVFIPANAFNEVSEDITVKVEEYYAMADLLSKDLSTVSDGKILESGGTIYIEAKSDNKQLQLKADQELTILFPKGPAADMRAFYGERTEDGNMNWKPATPVVKKEQTADSQDEHLVYVWMVDDRPKLKKKRSWLLKNGEGYLHDYFNNNYNSITQEEYAAAIFPFLEDFSKYISVYEDFEKATVEFSPEGKIKSIAFWTYQYFSPEINDFARKMPPVDCKSMKLDEDGRIDMYFSITSVAQTWEYKHYLQAMSRKNRDEVITKLSEEGLEYVALDVGNLGWINCDKYYKQADKIPETMDVFVENSSGVKAKYYMIFEDFKAMLAGTSAFDGSAAYFSKVPEGENIKIVALAYYQEQPLISVRETKIGDVRLKMSGFTPFTIDELKDALK